MRRLPEKETIAPRHFPAPENQIVNVIERKLLDGALWRRSVGSDLNID